MHYRNLAALSPIVQNGLPIDGTKRPRGSLSWHFQATPLTNSWPIICRLFAGTWANVSKKQENPAEITKSAPRIRGRSIAGNQGTLLTRSFAGWGTSGR